MSIDDCEAVSAKILQNVAHSAFKLKSAPDFIDFLPVAIYACDCDGHILWFNERAAEMWGRRPDLTDDNEKFCGSYKLFFQGRLTPHHECPMAVVLRTGIPVGGIEGKIERPDGTSVWATVHIQPVEDEVGDIIGAINCFNETTAVHHAADELEDFFESAAVALHLVSREGKIVRANRAELQMLGYSPEEYIGKSIAEFHVDDPTIDDILKRLLRHEPIYQHPARLRAKDGSIKHVVITSNARVRDGEFVNARCFTTDVTEQKKAQQALEKRMKEQSALYNFIARLQTLGTLEEIYDAALDTIIGALGCQRASILLFDATNKMRFVAWRYVSEDYRRAVDGHSPWARETNNPKPISIDDVQRSDLPGALKQTVKAEGIAALSFIPLLANGQLIGKFMTYYDQAHEFSEQEVEFATTLAHQLAFSIERLRATHASQRLASIVESSDDAIISKNLDGVIQTWNKGAERIFGYTAEEVVGKSVTILMPPDRIDEEPYILARIRSGENVDHYETIRRRKDGTLIDISLTVSPLFDRVGRITGASKIARDISGRKEAERQLRASEQKLQDLLAAIPAAIYTTDPEGKITYFNQAAVNFAGRTPTIGSDEWCISWKLYWPDGTLLPHNECPMAIALKEGRAVRGVEAVAERPDGTLVPFIPYPTPLRDAHGKLVGAINMLVDISERKQAETHQRVLLNELNHRVKNNMQMMQSLLDAAARRIGTPNAQRVLDEASRRIAALAAAQRVLYGTTNATQFKCDEFLSSVCRTVQETLPSNIKIICERSVGELPNDAAMPLALILNELLTNAAKHGIKTGVPDAIRATLNGDGDRFELSVEDEGPGFDLDAVRQQSSGIRLVQGLARQLGGQLHVTRDPTRCIVRFPRRHA